MKFADVKNDIAFRKIFGNENKTEILISFLNAVLNFEGERRVSAVELVNPYQKPIVIGAKASILDIRAKSQSGEEFIVEMQVTGQSTFFKRAVFYAAKSYTSQLDEKFEYKKLKPVIFIGIMNFNLLTSPNYISKHLVLDTKTYKQEFKDLDFNFIELEKFDKKEEELETLVDKWIYFIKHAKDLTVIPSNVNDKGLHAAYTEAEQHQWTKEELQIYQSYKMREADERAMYDTAIELGLEQGKKEGLEQGKKEEKLETAKKMKLKGYTLTDIIELLGLSKEDVERL